ncbi:MAG TPA: hypothetical protein VER55_13885, partial [Ardenticatenaceae bacterium]|nr:hypothetical protein [Ardenticatenaceae bacterium]
AQHEGETSARLAAQWIERQPAGVVIFRDAPGGPGQIGVPSGFLSMVALNEVSEEERNGDPGLQGPWRYLLSHAPLRAGERATVFRFWMARDNYQAISPIQTLIFVNMVRHYLVTPGLAFTFIPCAEPDFWTAVFAYGDLQRLPEADFEVDGRRFGVYGHDWRAVPPMAWLALLAERETASGAVEPTPPKPSEQLLVLSQTDFNTAVRDALRDLLQPEVLRGNPLLRSRLLLEVARGQDSARERASTLQALIKETIESLQKLPQQAKLYRVLYHTYVQPAPTQEQAAELLDLPFSTYRRHLKAGIEQVAERLWEQEVGAHEK